MNRLSWMWSRLLTLVFIVPQLGSHGRGVVIRKPLMLVNPKHIHVGDNFSMRDGGRLECVGRPGHEPGEIRIGNSCSIEQHVHITSAGLVEIGDFTSLSPRVTIAAAAHPIGQVSSGRSRGWDVDHWGSIVRIGQNVLIGAGAVILPGVTIGDNATIGANAVVTKDVPANSVAAGIPARVIRTFVPAES